ncbi:asparagine synthase (glutamine-hydrolyzing) [Afifella pfennigii]|uniref:asparagine synthase (glutamine-hydrolyzing) n=1 Tax=Afifella pfennigii TaxID=209897 RepID=UPI00047DF6F9|nr:asparagine synthase (glutamine-hydrolyzing) [Afifella pfennigii]
MCGIAGLIDPSAAGEAGALERRARAMADAIAHRGPDGAGVWSEPDAGLALAHRRLAIIDLTEAGAQPMVSADGRYVLTYNGEIYNAEEMRADPALSGIAWRGHSDTEVMLESFARRGIEATLAELNGMYAFALWDRRERILHLVRDRLGIKPLFFCADGRRLSFASELKAMHARGEAGRQIDPSAVASFLRFGYVPAPFSIFEGVEKLLPGEAVSFHADGRLERRHYWRLAEAATAGLADPLRFSDAQAEEALDALLGDAIARQMISDVPLGAFLSGGIDSSAVAALMVAAGKGPVRTFSIGFDSFGFDESRHAAAVARHLGTEHTQLTATAEEALRVVPTLPQMYDEPFADSSQIPTHLVSRLTREHVTVALSGDGGDELFAGYNRYAMAGVRWPQIERVPQPMRVAMAAAIARIPVGAIDALARFVPGLPGQPGDKAMKVASVLPLDAEGLYRRLVSQVPDPSLHIAAAEHGSDFGRPPAGLDFIDRMRFTDTLTYLPDDILQKIDRASMAVALEARPPLLDHRVVEFAWRLPRRFLIREGRSKWLLRRVLDRYVPEELIDRPKMGFGVPLAEWLRGPLKSWASELIEAEDYGGGLLYPQPARDLWRAHLSGGRNHAYQLWMLLSFEAWRRHWL